MARDVVRLGRFLRQRRSIWISILVILLFLANCIVLAVQTAAVSPYVYTLF
jgi:hypothetical protein